MRTGFIYSSPCLQQTLGQWRVVFLIASGVYIVSGTIFAIFGSSHVQPWAECEEIGGNNTKDKRLKTI